MATCYARWLGRYPHPTITAYFILASPHPLDVGQGDCRDGTANRAKAQVFTEETVGGQVRCVQGREHTHRRRLGAGLGAVRRYLYLLTGSVGETVTDLSQRLLAHHGGLRGLFRLDVAELARVRGLGDAKAVRVKAALELGRRLAALSPEERPPVGSPEDVANLLSIEMAALEQEQLRVVLLDTKHRILGTRTVYQGSVNQTK